MADGIEQRSYRDAIAGGVFLAIAAGFAAEASRYDFGSPLRMGPGFWPLFLAVLLAALGLAVLVVGLRGREMIQVTPVPWVAIGLVVAALAIFGLFARQLGLVPIVFLCTTLTAFASRNNTILSAVVIAAAMSVLCWLIFKVGLGITLPTFGPLFGF